jgi:hypothetical protein
MIIGWLQLRKINLIMAYKIAKTAQHAIKFINKRSLKIKILVSKSHPEKFVEIYGGPDNQYYYIYK